MGLWLAVLVVALDAAAAGTSLSLVCSPGVLTFGCAYRVRLLRLQWNHWPSTQWQRSHHQLHPRPSGMAASNCCRIEVFPAEASVLLR